VGKIKKTKLHMLSRISSCQKSMKVSPGEEGGYFLQEELVKRCFLSWERKRKGIIIIKQ